MTGPIPLPSVQLYVSEFKSRKVDFRVVIFVLTSSFLLSAVNNRAVYFATSHHMRELK